jgi:diguanylate cyclase (GGDEF)-like protein/putative nucleotidyltransferase with HDIG domain
MAVLDVDAFKATNDSAGHAAGDAALRSMAAALRAATRAGDVVGRLGGDEFAILFPEAGALDAMRAIERARATLAGPQPAGVPAVAFSAGICDLEQAVDAESLMRRADAALYLAKEHGRGLSWIYDHHVAAEISAEDRLASRRRTDALAGLQALARAIDAKDHGTREHSARVAELAAALARRLDWPQRRVELLHEAAVVHDVGKIGVPDAVLLKSGRLNPDEYEQVKHHAALGAQIIDGVLTPEQVGWVRGHHERCDGAGYPDGLRDADIPEGAAILAVADAFDAMTASRPYGVPLTVPEGLAECSRAAGTQFRPGIVAALLAMQADAAPAARDAALR